MSATDGESDQLQVQAGVTPGQQPHAALIISLDELQRLWTEEETNILPLSSTMPKTYIYIYFIETKVHFSINVSGNTDYLLSVRIHHISLIICALLHQKSNHDSSYDQSVS
jgi:hypothetical protein